MFLQHALDVGSAYLLSLSAQARTLLSKRWRETSLTLASEELFTHAGTTMQCSLLLAFLLALAHPHATTSAASDGAKIRRGDILYTMTNDAAGNSVVMVRTSPDGRLRLGNRFRTGGLGTSMPLGNQGALTLSSDGQWLLVVNPGSDDVTLFRVQEDGALELLDVVGSGGLRPISVALHGNQTWVLNAGGQVGSLDNIVAFDIATDGSLGLVPNSQRALSAESTNPAQVGVSPDGRLVVVTEKDTDRIDVFLMGSQGIPVQSLNFPSTGVGPFGFAFDSRGRLLVSEAFDGLPNQSALSSYRLLEDGSLQPLDSEKTTETAACWVVLSRNDRYAYVTNTGSSSVSGFAIGDGGELQRLDANGVTGVTGSMPIDMAVSVDGHFLYTLNAGTLSAFVIRADGSLAELPKLTIGQGWNGLVAR